MEQHSTSTMPLPTAALPSAGETSRPGGLRKGHGFGTAPVFLASISTILGAILFLRFGYAVGHVGVLGVLAIIALGDLGRASFVAIPSSGTSSSSRRVSGSRSSRRLW